MYQAMFDEVIRLRKTVSRRERSEIRNFITEAYRLFAEKSSRKEGKEMENLSNVKTCELVEELKQREGVETILAEPYESQKVLVEGPAVVLVVTD